MLITTQQLEASDSAADDQGDPGQAQENDYQVGEVGMDTSGGS
ncbi:hypothetical protein ACFLX9_00415 [Chloroflexota bacterium]